MSDRQSEKALLMTSKIFSITVLTTFVVMLSSGCGKKAPPPEPDYKVLETNVVSQAAPAPNSAMVRLDAKPGSSVRIEGTSTLHNWQVIGKLIGGYLELPTALIGDSGAQVNPGIVEAHCETFIPVRSLRSVTKEGNAYSTMMDDIMYEKFLAGAHPRILYRLQELVLKTAATNAGSPMIFDSRGDLVVAGVTNEISMPVTITVVGDNTLRVSGSVDTKMSAFKIETPAPAGMLIKTGAEVKLLFEWAVGRKPTTAPATTGEPK